MSIFNIMEEDWKYLIILDACRYDYFSDLYSNFFKGDLKKGISKGSSTLEWCINSFNDYYNDVVYISGNPYINSHIEIRGFDAKKHFKEIIDVWKFGWNEKVGTVLPNTINKTMIKLMKNDIKDKKYIIHYLQPHAPYISKKYLTTGFPTPNPENKHILTGIQGQDYNTINKIMDKVVSILVGLKILQDKWTLRSILNLPPSSPLDAVRIKYGIDGLKEAYKFNLIIVLQHVKELCKELLKNNENGKIILTSDHGELLGENNKYSHKRGSKNKLLLEIPVFYIKNVVDIPYEDNIILDVETSTEIEELTINDKKVIEDRLKKLGYIE